MEQRLEKNLFWWKKLQHVSWNENKNVLTTFNDEYTWSKKKCDKVTKFCPQNYNKLNANINFATTFASLKRSGARFEVTMFLMSTGIVSGISLVKEAFIKVILWKFSQTRKQFEKTQQTTNCFGKFHENC